TDTPTPFIDLVTEKTTDSNFNPGQNVTFTLVVTNEGTKATTGPIIVTDTLDPVFTYISITGDPPWDCSATVAPNISCTHPGPLAPGNSLPTLTLIVKLNPPGAFIIQNTAMVTTVGDSIPDND